MKFSVLLSLYYKESPDFLRQSLESVFAQTLPPDEVVLVEDGPLTTELYKVVNEFQVCHPEMKIVKLEKNGGLGNALNIGLRYCSYDLVARMDTDDVCKPNRFEKQLAYMNEHNEIAVCSAWIDEFEGNVSNAKSTRKLPEMHEAIYKYGKKRCPINHPCAMYRKHLVQSNGGYQDFPEDYPLWVKMLMTRCKFYNIQESLLFFRVSPNMFQRRGGGKYARKEMKMLMSFYKVGYINIRELLESIFIRMTVRSIPNNIRGYIYKHLLR